MYVWLAAKYFNKTCNVLTSIIKHTALVINYIYLSHTKQVYFDTNCVFAYSALVKAKFASKSTYM